MPLLTSIIAASRRRVDPDAADYFARIAAAGSTISAGNQAAVNAFVVGCKADGIWAAIKASCLLAGPDDLTGALVPLVGAAPTNINFVSGDYSRTAGLKSNGTTKRLDANRTTDTDPESNRHIAFYATEANSSERAYMGDSAATGGTRLRLQSNFSDMAIALSGTQSIATSSNNTGFVGASRSSSASINYRSAGSTSNLSNNSQTPAVGNACLVFGVDGYATQSNARLSFYSIGESLDLALLDARLATYMSALT
jgi:hypothetical protein